MKLRKIVSSLFVYLVQVTLLYARMFSYMYAFVTLSLSSIEFFWGLFLVWLVLHHLREDEVEKGWSRWGRKKHRPINRPHNGTQYMVLHTIGVKKFQMPFHCLQNVPALPNPPRRRDAVAVCSCSFRIFHLFYLCKNSHFQFEYVPSTNFTARVFALSRSLL